MTTSVAAKRIEIGDVLNGRYRIDALLGSGGMGSVYLAEHVRIGRAVAVKVLDVHVGADHEAAQRFKREALASGRLDHPNIVAVSDFGLLPSGRSYLVMEALEGESLGARLEQRAPLPWRDAVAIASSILQGLQHAHDRGVVHRDIKPDNIFLANKDGQATVKILDFGIAKLVGGEADDSVSTTRTGMTVGTPAYLSPEQARGDEVDARSDQFSLAVTAYELLTGSLPWRTDPPIAVIASILTDTPPPLALPDGAGIEEVLQRALAKRARERYPDLDAFADALTAGLPPLLSARPFLGAPPPSWRQLAARAIPPTPDSGGSALPVDRAPIRAACMRS